MNSGGFNPEFWLRILAYRIIVNRAMQMWHQAHELRAIEQATYDREFWEMVDAAH